MNTNEVEADEDLAAQLAVHAVPAYILNGQRLVTGVRSAAELVAFCGL